MTAPVYDAAIIGAGAAGMMAAAVAGQRGLRVVLIDHADKLAEKIRISGGGRCNFTNLGATPAQFLSQNPHFCKAALAAYTPRDFIALVERHRIAWHEKHRGQLFCDDSSERIIRMLERECEAGQVAWRMSCAVKGVERTAEGYAVHTARGAVHARQLVLATGGMAIPQLGATDFALGVARQFGLKVVEPRPALVPLVFDAASWRPYAALSGVSLRAVGRCGTGGSAAAFDEDLLFTHRGLSGPAILQLSSYWRPGQPLVLDLAPDTDLAATLLALKPGARQQLGSALAGIWPRRLADAWLAQLDPADAAVAQRRLADVPDKLLRRLAEGIHGWTLHPSGTEGYRKAEVMSGGVDTRGLDQKTMQARQVPGLYFVGEAVDVTGWLGGYNFQWAWASGVACGRGLQARP